MESYNEVAQTRLVETLTSSLDRKFEKLSADPTNSAASIYNVPHTLRELNEEAYTPKLVSIGPLHRGRVELQAMEAFKLRSAHNFLSRYGIGLDTIVKFAASEESFVRGCYDGAVYLPPEDLAEVILLDGIFIVDLFLKNYFSRLRDTYESIFDNSWLHNNLLHDMLLLENQLPMRIMESLLQFVKLFDEGASVSIYELAHKFFYGVGLTHKVALTERSTQARHLVEFLLLLHAPAEVRIVSARKPNKFEYTRSARELVQAGVKLQSGEGDCLFEFSFSNGVLTIPKLTINESTETFFQNLIAFEHLGYYGYFSKLITSYVMLMDSLIKTSGDVNILIKYGIIENQLGGNRQVVYLFNNLYKGVLTDVHYFYFSELAEALNAYKLSGIHKWKCRWFRWRMMVLGKCIKWRVMLMETYFSSPWSIVSLVGAILLFCVTVAQTYFSYLQVR